MVTLGQNLLKLQWLSWINLNIWYKVNSFTFEQLFREGFFGFKNQQIKAESEALMYKWVTAELR